MKLKSSNLFLGFTLLAILAGTGAKMKSFHSAPLVAQAATTQNAAQQLTDVADEAPLPQDSKEREARLTKNRRYNGGHCHLTAGRDCFFEIFEPWRLPEIPLEKSNIAFVGTVTQVQPYLAEDGSRIYTETTFHVEELFKRPANFTLASDRTLVIDRNGGAVRTHSGQILRDDTRDGFLGRPRVGMRYVFFADSIHGGKDFSMLRGTN